VFILLKYHAISKPQVHLILKILEKITIITPKWRDIISSIHSKTSESRTLRSTHVEGLFDKWLLSITECSNRRFLQYSRAAKSSHQSSYLYFSSLYKRPVFRGFTGVFYHREVTTGNTSDPSWSVISCGLDYAPTVV